MPRKILQATEFFDRPHGQRIAGHIMIMREFQDEIAEFAVEFDMRSLHCRRSLCAGLLMNLIMYDAQTRPH
ncbi:hypothetical protein [Methylobacterium frigidaeris]|nr:hypothetical protein [Methylobacterium frigidaeris]PIK73774.1 hypothetical protein CS379_06500 [Methylobacterium frigidaeris]